jgi:phosphoribosylanthranilate isomerase
MKIVNQNNTKIVELNTIQIYSRYPEEIQIYLNEIYDRRIVKAYNYGSTENCKKAIKEKQEKYLIGKKKEYMIVVNGDEFAIYKTEIEVNDEFYNIKEAITENKNIYCLN